MAKAKKVTSRRAHPQKVKPKTHVAIVLDRSTSMQSIWKEIISGFNNQVKTIKAIKDQDVRVSLTTFSSTVDEVFFDQPVESLKELEPANLHPWGNTAMLDAVGQTITRLNNLEYANDPNQSFLLIVISDGEENSSRLWPSFNLAPLMKSIQNNGRWTVSYMGANQDLTKVSKTLHIPYANTMTFTSSNIGTMRGFQATNTATSTYFSSRAQGNLASTNFYDQNATSAGQAGQSTGGANPGLLNPLYGSLTINDNNAADALKKAK